MAEFKSLKKQIKSWIHHKKRENILYSLILFSKTEDARNLNVNANQWEIENQNSTRLNGQSVGITATKINNDTTLGAHQPTETGEFQVRSLNSIHYKVDTMFLTEIWCDQILVVLCTMQ